MRPRYEIYHALGRCDLHKRIVYWTCPHCQQRLSESTEEDLDTTRVTHLLLAHNIKEE